MAGDLLYKDQKQVVVEVLPSHVSEVEKEVEYELNDHYPNHHMSCVVHLHDALHPSLLLVA